MTGQGSLDDAGQPRIVAIGASAGGLQAVRSFLEALDADGDFAWIFVQHLDPTHDSMLPELLARYTHLQVLAATDGAHIKRGHLYVIPPDAALAVSGGTLRLTAPNNPRGARMPFDFLLNSLAAEYGARSIAIILSGTGADGTAGALAIRAAGGLVLVQEPSEATHDGMPSSAIEKGAASLVLPVAQMPAALMRHLQQGDSMISADVLPRILELVKARCDYDFEPYKPGTLRRRVEHRMGIIGNSDPMAYLERLRSDPDEALRLAQDMLIHVTSFFRDPDVYEALAREVLPGLIEAHPDDQPLRIWIAGCSTGEETWSIAILFREAIMAAGRNIQLKIFASDLDPESINFARGALYSREITKDVSAERLRQFFVAEEGHWRVRQDLRACVIFAVHNVLVDPPFARLDFISCRNLMIYLKPAAQLRVIATLHFALSAGGLLLLGNAEALGGDGFELVSRQMHLWRRSGLSNLAGGPPPLPASTGAGRMTVPSLRRASSRRIQLAELCRSLVLESHAPAAMLLDSTDAIIYSMGPTERYFAHASGQPTHHSFSMAKPELRGKLREAVAQARETKQRVSLAGASITEQGEQRPLQIHALLTTLDNEPFVFLCLEELSTSLSTAEAAPPRNRTARSTALEREAQALRDELSSALHRQEILVEEQRIKDEEVLSITEEHQSAHEELLTSKEELQSLNEELTALNGQLEETLEHSRVLARDLQNVLYSTDVATLFLDMKLCIRFFTPASSRLFSILPRDVGRPLADLRAILPDPTLLQDAAKVLADGEVRSHEIEADGARGYLRRVLPYRALDGKVDGIVITYTDVTERNAAALAVQLATERSQLANTAKARFLSAVSHDLRQPLQTLSLLQDLALRVAGSDEARRLLAQMEQAIASMSSMLNTLLDLNQVTNGFVVSEIRAFPVDRLLRQLGEEFSYLAAAQRLELRVVPSSLTIVSDQVLLEQILRNLLGNALKYTPQGKILLGCRRRGDRVTIEVHDTGIGIEAENIEAIFSEYVQLDNPARDIRKGLGLGLSIAMRLAGLLGHRLTVRSTPGRGSCFSIEAATTSTKTKPVPMLAGPGTGMILVVEDNAAVRDLLVELLTIDGHRVVAASDGEEALRIVHAMREAPRLMLADYSLPGTINGIELGVTLREAWGKELPCVILTADSSAQVQEAITARGFVGLPKPVKPQSLAQLVQRLLSVRGAATPEPQLQTAGTTLVYLVDDDDYVRTSMADALREEGFAVRDYPSAEAFTAAYQRGGRVCLLVDARLPGQSGLELLAKLREAGDPIPTVIITGFSDVPTAIQAMRCGASDFIAKPVRIATLRDVISGAMERSRDVGKILSTRAEAAGRLATLTHRQREILERVLAGDPSKNIAADFNISRRTVEAHRAAIMHHMGVKSLPALVRLVISAKDEDARPHPR